MAPGHDPVTRGNATFVAHGRLTDGKDGREGKAGKEGNDGSDTLEEDR